MRERGELIFRIACYALAALLLYRVILALRRSNPLADLQIPALPTLSADTNAPAGAKTTNAPAPQDLAKKGTNAPAQAVTNAAAAAASVKASTNTPPADDAETKKAALLAQQDALKNATNMAARIEPGKIEPVKTGTNVVAQASGTNAPPRPRPETARTSPSPPGGRKTADLPLPIKARVDRIYDSELLGPIMRPQPMALLGIAGNTAFLRSPSGQTGLVKEGGQLGEIKLLKIGINRVLVEQDGEKKELMIFSGYGGESLLPKP